MFGRKIAKVQTPAFDIELFDAIAAGRITPNTFSDVAEWFDAVKAGRISL